MFAICPVNVLDSAKKRLLVVKLVGRIGTNGRNARKRATVVSILDHVNVCSKLRQVWRVLAVQLSGENATSNIASGG